MLELLFSKPKTHYSTKDGIYQEYNQWETDIENNWMVRFLRANFPNNKKKISFFGPLGNPFFLRRKFDTIKVFFTMEDLDHPRTKLHLFYGDYALPYVDFSMGLGDRKDSKYLRFPYWLVTTFRPESTEDDIVRRIQAINTTHYEKFQECVLINKHDKMGTREMIYKGVRDILDVKLAGVWKNNTRDLWDKYDNNKEAYVRTFKFNICSENDNTPNYVTEKLFDAFICDCVPLYYGSDNNPEPGLINREAVIFWNKDGDNRANRELIKRLNVDPRAYSDFMHQQKFTPYAEEWVINRFAMLREHYKRILME